jgi:hypothetical protein
MEIEFGLQLIAAFRLLQLPYYENIFSNWLNTDTDFEILKKINIFSISNAKGLSGLISNRIGHFFHILIALSENMTFNLFYESNNL